ncbi:MAG: polyprenyl synthetase family protein [Alloprevotella sp.]|nr:MAG: polyprenyl synthetase family protein [Alloprevotella sp.]
MLQKIENAIRSLPFPTQPEGLYEPIEYVLSMGGKRLRPMLLLTAYRLFRPDYERAMSAAVGIETYHNHTLLHDDLMDRAEMRRGQATVHCRWNDNTAVLSGDTMLLLAYRLIASTAVGRMEEVMALFTQSAIQICEGQQMDVNFETRADVSEAEYIEMIRLKTSVLLGCAAKMGALLADAPAADCNTLYAFAEKVGLAFQLQDDYLDTFGDPEVFGKKIGGDILCGKKTFLVHATLARMSATEAADFLALLNCTDLPSEEKIARVTEVYRRHDVPAVCEARIADFFEEAHRLLAHLSVDAAPLWAYAETLLRRKK